MWWIQDLKINKSPNRMAKVRNRQFPFFSFIRGVSVWLWILLPVTPSANVLANFRHSSIQNFDYSSLREQFISFDYLNF